MSGFKTGTSTGLDFRIEAGTSTSSNMLFVDAGSDRVGIGTSAPDPGPTTMDVMKESVDEVLTDERDGEKAGNDHADDNDRDEGVSQ